MKRLFFILSLAAVFTFSTCNNSDDEMPANQADLELSFESIAAKPEIGQMVNFKLSVLNRGPLSAQGVAVEVSIPPAYLEPGNASDGGIYDAGSSTILWSGVSIEPDKTITLSFSAVVGNSSETTDYNILAQITGSDLADPDSAPNNMAGSTAEDDESMLSLPPVAGTMVLNFKASYGQEPLLMFERDYAYEDNMAIKMQLFQFYLSEVSLTKDGGVRLPILDVDLISFGDVFDEAAAAEGQNSRIPTAIPPGGYTGIEFTFGLTPALNATIPPDYELGHPLSENYWEASSSYIFYKFEGNVDLNANGEFPDKLTFHVGGNENMRTLTFGKPILIEDEKEVQLNFNIDLQKMLVDEANDEYLDFRQVTQSHSNSSPAATFMSNNIGNAIDLE